MTKIIQDTSGNYYMIFARKQYSLTPEQVADLREATPELFESEDQHDK